MNSRNRSDMVKDKYNKRDKMNSSNNKIRETESIDIDKLEKLNKSSESEKSDEIDISDTHRLADLYFKQKNVIYSHLYNSFNKFLDEDVRNILMYGDNSFHEKLTRDKLIRYKFKYENIAVKPPSFDADDEVMFPSDARTKNMTYSVKLVATVTQIQEIVDVNTDEKMEKVIGVPEKDVPITVIPTMVRSKYCSLNIKKGKDKTECDLDPGGYFIVNGSEKVVVSLEKICENKPLTFSKKDSNTIIYTVQVNSKSHKANGLTQIAAIRMKKDDTMLMRVPIFTEVSVFIIFRALGVESDKDIINYCVYDKNDTDMINLIRLSLDDCINEKTKKKIMTQDDAVDYLTVKLRILKKYTDTDKDVKYNQKKLHVLHLLEQSFLPHVEGGRRYKAFFLGYMINRLMNVVLQRIPVDDRDSFINKRVDLPGDLICELFKQHYKKMLNECARVFKKRNVDDDNPFNIINQIKPSTIEQGLKTALLTGAWSGKRKGVAQMLERRSYLQTISSLRRINSPTVDASTNKLTSPRHIHPTQLGFICFVETPEGHKVGLVKSISLIGNVTVSRASQVFMLKSILKNKVKDLRDIPSEKLNDYTKVFTNGEWLGVITEPQKLYIELKKMKISGAIENTTSIVFDIEHNELRIQCDGGRLYRPVMRVKNNTIQYDKNHSQMISIEDTPNPTQITKWNEFMLKFPGVLEYIDMEEQSQAMIAMEPSDVEKMKQRMVDSVEIVKKMTKEELQKVVNRYDDTTFIKYTHCEIDPSLLMGTVVNNIPFCNHNQGPRNMFQFSQAKQGMGIYITNWRHRLDISYILYHVQKPLVNTRAMKYLNTDRLGFGENVIVAIECYTGYNQEDSILLNQSAIDRGLFRSTSVKKYVATITKNQNTSQNDNFMKPDPLRVTGMGHGSYDKLNDKGFIPEETRIENGDIVIGIVSPIIQTGGTDKQYKDKSEVYKSHVGGRIDKVYSGIQNHEGYEMMKVRIRSERTPIIGDKFCSRAAQKGTVGLTIKQSDMPFSSKTGMSPDLIMNPNAIPSRMTLGQFLETITGKLSALKGIEFDGTPFQRFDLDKIRKELENMGYRDDGTEELYSGMTGKPMRRRIFIGPTYYMRLKHLVLDKIHCLTMDHEVLTDNGWKFFKDINDEDKLLSIDICSRKIAYKKPIEKLFFKNRNVELYHVKNDNIDTVVTNGHRLLIGEQTCANFEQPNSYRLISVEDLLKNLKKHKKSFSTTQYTCFINNEHKNDNCVFGAELKLSDITYIGNMHTDVFCFVMPNETFYVRRNGFEFWSGNSRSRGPRTLLTHQAPEGRSRDGGLRFGEMERDCIISHGMAKFLKERMLETADAYTTYVCDDCGLFAQRMKRTDNKPYPTKNDIYICPACDNKTRVSKIMIPYAFKLLCQELLAMDMAPRIRIRKDRFNEI